MKSLIAISLLEAEPVAQCGDREAPGVVGHADLVAGDRRRDRQRPDAAASAGCRAGARYASTASPISAKSAQAKVLECRIAPSGETSPNRALVAPISPTSQAVSPGAACSAARHQPVASAAASASTKLRRQAFASLRRNVVIIAFHRSRRSPSGMSSPCRIASAIPSRSIRIDR